MAELRLLLEHANDPEYQTLKGYEKRGGFEALRKAVKMERQAIIDEIKASGLRGRGGAGFPAWIKWNGIPKEKPLAVGREPGVGGSSAGSREPVTAESRAGDPTSPPPAPSSDTNIPRRGGAHYILCNADEGEPGTFKDKELMERTPFLMIEGMIIAGLATQADAGYVYIRGEFIDAAKAVRKAIDEAYAAGYLGKNILGSGWDFDMYIHMGAGSYECGEESALMNSLIGERGMPRLKFPHAPLPTVAGLWDRPTVINNVETYACAPFIIKNGGAWYATMGASTKNSRGTKIFSVSGHVKDPRNFEIEFGTPLMELLALAGGMKGGKLKACVPGGSSVPIIDAKTCEQAIIGYEEMADVKSMVGSGGCIFLNEHTCIVTFIWRTSLFYARESCGKCTPCREGTKWLVQVLERIMRGAGRPDDMQTLEDICAQIDGRSLCALGDAAAWPVQAALRVFPEEFEYYIRHGRSLVGTSEPVRS